MTNEEALATVKAMLGRRDPKSLAAEALSTLSVAIAELRFLTAAVVAYNESRPYKHGKKC